MSTGREVTIRAMIGMAFAMGIGRFAFTPLMPLMIGGGVMSKHDGALIATANYLGYLVGAVVLTLWPRINTQLSFRAWIVILVGTEALMAATDSVTIWFVLRLLAGYASAVLFVGMVSTVGAYVDRGAMPGLVFGGVGMGFVLMGVLSLALATSLSWQAMWLSVAALSLVLGAVLWRLQIHPEESNATTPERRAPLSSAMRWTWRLLLGAYFLEGLGYIIIGTFIVAAVGTGTGISAVVWVVAGIAAIPANLIYQRIAKRSSFTRVLLVAYFLQTVGAALPFVSDQRWASFACAVLYGGTFLGIAMMSTMFGRTLPVARSAAALTTVYSVGQVLGPLVVAPVIGTSYTMAFAIAAVVIGVGGLLMVGVARCHAIARRDDPEVAVTA